jgi:hypothetical protein
MAFNVGQQRFTLRRRGGGILDLDTVQAVWWRRPQPFGLSAGTAAVHQRFAISEATTAFHGLYEALHAYWVNIPSRDVVAAHRPYQLALAQEIGLAIPPPSMCGTRVIRRMCG